MRGVVEQAGHLGFTDAIMLTDLVLTCRPELRASCSREHCPTWGRNWVCPPGSGPLESCQERVAAFHDGILLRSTTALTPPTSPQRYGELQRAHNLRLRELIAFTQPQVGALLALSTGGCLVCDECSYPAPCLHPDVKMESLSAFGIDVGALCTNAGLPFSFSDDQVAYVAVLLFDYTRTRVNRRPRSVSLKTLAWLNA